MQNKGTEIITFIDFHSTNENSKYSISNFTNLFSEPDYYSLIGEFRTLSNGKILSKPNTKTIVTFKFSFQTFYLKDINKELIKFFNNNIIALRKLLHQYEFQIKITYEFTLNSVVPSLYLETNFLNFINQFNASIDFDIYTGSKCEYKRKI